MQYFAGAKFSESKVHMHELFLVVLKGQHMLVTLMIISFIVLDTS